MSSALKNNNKTAKNKLSTSAIQPVPLDKRNKALSEDEYFMRKAMELAKQAESHNEIPVGAVIVANNQVVGEGFNQSIMNNDPSAHAEVMAIRDAGKTLENYRLLDCTLYVTLEPCMMCSGLLVHSRISRLVYGAKDLKTGAAGSAFDLVEHENHNHKIVVTEGILAEECGQLLSSFFKRRRKEIKEKRKQNKLT